MSSVRFLIALNIAVFIGWAAAERSQSDLMFMYENFLVSWDSISEGRIWTLLTSVFSHNMLLHIFFNMYALSSFGPLIERVLGTRSFLTFYFFAGIISSFCHALVSLFILGDPSIPALGASGAISGIILLFALIYPREKILLFGIIPLPALFGSFLFIGLDIWGLIAQAEGGGLPIGHGAHLGGALTGFLYYAFFLRPRFKKRTNIYL